MRKVKLVSTLLIISFLSATAINVAMAQSPSATPTPTPRANQLKTRTCEARESAIKNKIQSLVRLTNNIFEKFGNIFDRVKEYYQTSGKTVGNYEQLVSDIESKKATVQTALDKAQDSAADFNCQADGPKNLYTRFRTNMQTVKAALKEYRTAIKNLIVAVRGATKSPKPTSTPEESSQ